MSKNNQLSILEQAQNSVKAVSNLEEAISLHMGKSAFETKLDSDGNEYVSATFRLLAPTKDHNEIVVNDITLAQKLEKMRRLSAMGEVSNFALCRLLADIADSEASSVGFSSTEELANAILAKGKSTLANYKRIGLYFVTAENDTIALRGAIPQECSISLLNQLLSFVVTEAEDGKPDISNVECLFKYGILTPYMKQKDYKRIISALSSMKTDKELKEMSLEEVEIFKKELSAILNAKPQKQEKKQEQEQEQESALTSNDPKVVLGGLLSTIHEVQEASKKLTLSEEQAQLVNTWLDNLYITYSELLG